MLARMSSSRQTRLPSPRARERIGLGGRDGRARAMQAPGRGSPPGAIARRLRLPELCALVALAAVLNLWALGRNGWANDYYSAAVRSMSSSWHNFLFASLDPSGVMTVDKPPLALWVQALSVRLFGYHPLSMLVPQALMGVASVVLVYDLVRRVFGRLGGFIAGLAMATTPIVVAVSRHNNPDALLVLCTVAAMWFAVRALQDGRTRWLVLCGVCVGLGFETKMLVALTVVPGIALAWLWVAPAARGRMHALRQLLAGGAAMLLVGGAWPALVELVPASDRPWVSGTSDNSVLSLIFGYNGLGRVDGQAGGPGGGDRRRNDVRRNPRPAAAAQLGARRAGRLAARLRARRRRRDPARQPAAPQRRAQRLADRRRRRLPDDGGALQRGERHLPPLLRLPARALRRGPRRRRRGPAAARRPRHRPPLSSSVLAPLAVAAGVAVELVVRSRYPGQLAWLPAVLVGVGARGRDRPRARERQGAHRRTPRRRGRADARSGRMGLRHARLRHQRHVPRRRPPVGGSGRPRRSGRVRRSGGFGGPDGPARARRLGCRRAAVRPRRLGGQARAAARPQGATGPPAGGPRRRGRRAGPGAQGAGPRAGPAARRDGGGFAARAGRGAIGAPFGQGRSLSAVLSYTRAHGGGTIAVSSQSSASSSIIEQGADVAGIGGFSGRESDVSVSWLAQEVRRGQDPLGARRSRHGAPGGFGARPAGRHAQRLDGVAMAAAAKACTRAAEQPGPARARDPDRAPARSSRNALRLPGPRRRAHGARRAEVSLLTRASPVRGVRRGRGRRPIGPVRAWV